MKLFQIDAFTNTVFSGNPAAVVPLEKWADDVTLQSIAAENNLAETAFYVPVAEHWELRWFTPTNEVALCGHATLAAAHVLVKHMGCQRRHMEFETRQSGKLTVTQMEGSKKNMHARQLSRRGGRIDCTLQDENRVLLAGHAVDYLVGKFVFELNVVSTS